jgi:Protein of unknown function (DUF938)
VSRTLRNRDFILDVSWNVLPTTGVILEIASGSGEHIVHFARNFPAVVFQPSDPEPDAVLSVAAWVKATGVTNVRPPIALDVSNPLWPIASADGIICINMVHISPWDATLGLIKGAAAILSSGARLYLYGPYLREGIVPLRATKPLTGGFAIAIQPGVCETSKPLPRWPTLLDSRSWLSPKCPQQSERGVPASLTVSRCSDRPPNGRSRFTTGAWLLSARHGSAAATTVCQKSAPRNATTIMRRIRPCLSRAEAVSSREVSRLGSLMRNSSVARHRANFTRHC